MSGIDYEPLRNWELSDHGHAVRNRPVRLLDREALHALIAQFRRYFLSNDFVIRLDEQESDSSLTTDELLDQAPRRISVVHIYSSGRV